MQVMKKLSSDSSLVLPSNEAEHPQHLGITNYRKSLDLVIVDQMYWPNLKIKGNIIAFESIGRL